MTARQGVKVEWLKDIREEGNEKLLLLITLQLPFDDVCYVHHCREQKEMTSVRTKNKRQCCALM